MEPLKEMFNKAFYIAYADVFAKVYTGFEQKRFIADVTANLESLSLNERLRNTSVVLHKYLPGDYRRSLDILYQAAPLLKTGYTALVLPDFVALYGLKDFQVSMEALRYFTVFGSSEFAVREFIKYDLNKSLAIMKGWAEDKNHHVRRLASEGSRPRLPWSFKLDAVIKNPSLTRPILECLQSDEELYVRKSVANHLNDISKDNPDFMLDLVKGWDITNPHTRWIIKHASRSLIKKGNAGSLALFDFEKNIQLKIEQFRLSARRVEMGGAISFTVVMRSLKKDVQKLVVDYAINYARKSGERSRKVFKLKELELKGQETIVIAKKQSFADLTTRKHFPGKHSVELLVNGQSLASQDFVIHNG